MLDSYKNLIVLLHPQIKLTFLLIAIGKKPTNFNQFWSYDQHSGQKK